MIRFKKLDRRAVLPTRGTEFSAGLDLYAIEIRTPVDAAVCVAHTGLAVDMSNTQDPHFGMIAPRSGLARRHGISIFGGIIDNDYTGELVVMMSLNAAAVVRAGDRVAQLIILPYSPGQPEWTSRIEPTERGGSGFGSTGR